MTTTRPVYGPEVWRATADEVQVLSVHAIVAAGALDRFEATADVPGFHQEWVRRRRAELGSQAPAF